MVIFLLLQLVPVLIMLTLLAVLHIKIIDGHLSGFVLISQMVTLQFPGLGYSSWIPVCSGSRSEIWNFSSIPLTVYSIWNLNFLNLDPVPFCIPHIDTATEAILLQYTTAACPLVFIVVTYTWIKCYNNGYRLVVYTTRPVHQLLARFWQKLKIQPSLIDTYAGLMLLSYMRFLVTSAKLLKYTFVNMDDSYTIAFYYDANLSYFGSASCCIRCPGNIVSTGICSYSNYRSLILPSQIFPAMSDKMQVEQARSACTGGCLSGLLQKQCN